MNLVEWADKYRYLSPESSSIPGKWKTSTIEAARGPMLEVTNPRCHTITIMGATQMLKSELINNIIGFHIHQDPCPMLVMYPTLKLAETWAADRLDKMIRDTPVITELVAKKRSKSSDDGENLKLKKSFPGGYVAVIGANSPGDLSSRPIRIVLADEVDKYKPSAGKEGDPIKLAEERTATFFNRKHIRVCSPTIEGQSRIAEEYEKGDQRTYHGLCPYCNNYEDLKWEQVRYDQSNVMASTCYECSHCHTLWNETDRLYAINHGKSIAKKPFNGHASFHFNKIASPWEPLYVLVEKFLDAKNDIEKLKTFYNTQLAETFKVKSDAPDYMRLYERREHYSINTVNDNVRFLTCGVDVQGNRFEVEIVGWCEDKQSYSIDYRVIPGNTALKSSWKSLDEILNETWVTSDGRQLKVMMMCVDSGYNTQHVYNWVKDQDPLRVRATKGQDHLQMIFGKPTDVELNYDGKRIKNATQVWPIGVSLCKGELYSWLKLDGAVDGGEYPSGFCHFPQYDENYFKGLCSEQLVEYKFKGRTAFQWEKKFDRNEPLDVRIMARCAASMFGMDRFTSEEWAMLKGEYTHKNDTNNDNIEAQTDLDDGFWGNKRGNRGFW